MCKQDICYSAIPDQDPGFNGSSRCNVGFFCWLFCVVYIYALYCFEDCKSVTNIMFQFEDTVMLLVIQYCFYDILVNRCKRLIYTGYLLTGEQILPETYLP